MADMSRPRRSPDESWLPSRLVLGWATPVAIRGMLTPLTPEDLPAAPRRIRPEPLHRQAIELWAAERARTAAGEGSVLNGVLWPVARATMLQGSVLLVLSGLLNSVARPLLLQAIRAMRPEVPVGQGLGLAGALAASLLLETWAKTQGMHLAGDVAVLRAYSSAMQLVSLKAGLLRIGSASEGVEQTLLGKDLIGVSEFARFLPMLFLSAASLVGGIVVLFVTAGLSGGVGLLVMLSTLLIALPLGRKSKQWQAAMLKAPESTTAVTREILDGVKVVKSMGWEAAYLEHVGRKRAVELGFLRLYRVALNIVVQVVSAPMSPPCLRPALWRSANQHASAGEA
jgi:hypothetical protein